MVAECSVGRRRYIRKYIGDIRSNNVGMSNNNLCFNLDLSNAIIINAEKLRVSLQGCAMMS